MSHPSKDDRSLLRAELDIVTAALGARFPTKGTEDRRIAHMHEMLAAAGGLSRALVAYTQHGLVHCRGTRGCSDLEADAASLYEALEAWSDSVRTIAALYPIPVDESEGEPAEPPRPALAPRFDYAG
jgi:hypothetical protein